MAIAKIVDRVKETSLSSGTGNFILNGAVPGYRAFRDVIGDGETTFYCISYDLKDEWEIGIGLYNSASNTLVRDTILASSNNDQLVNFSKGVKSVFINYPAEKSVVRDYDQNQITLPNTTFVGSQYQSTISDGTPPLVVSSSTLIPNLNAEYVGNYSASMLSKRSTADKTIYVDASSGNDTAGDGTSGNPYATINRALEDVPEVLLHNYTIQLSPGVYRESIIIKNNGLYASADSGSHGKLIIQGDAGDPNSYRITGANVGSETTPIRSEGIKIEGSAYVSLDGILIDYYTRSCIHVVGGQVEIKTVNLENTRYGLWGENGAYINLRNSILNINVNHDTNGIGVLLYRNTYVEGSTNAIINIYNAWIGWYQTSGTVGLNIGTITVSNDGATKGLYGIDVWTNSVLHGLKVNITNFQYGVLAANVSDVDVDGPSTFTNVDTAIDSGGTTFMDVDEVTFTNVAQKYRVGPGGFVDATGESSTGKMLYQLQGASPTADSASAVAHWLDTVGSYSAGKLLSIRSGGSEKFYIAHDGNIYVGSNRVWHAGNLDPNSFATSDHNHNDTYLKLLGGTISGNLTIDGGVGVSAAGTLRVRQKGDTVDDGISLTSSAPASFRMFVDAGNLVHFTRSDQSDSAIRIDSGRRVGIRTNPNSSYNLTVAGGVQVSSGTLEAPTLRLTATADATITSTGHALQIGPTSGENIIADGNEIMARNNGSTSTLYLNPEGGDVIINHSAGGGAIWHAGNLDPNSFATSGHDHDGRYLRLSGGTLTGYTEVRADLRIGKVSDPNTGTLPGYGNRLYFSGGPAGPAWSSDNSDPIWMARYNADSDKTELRVNIGDNVADLADRFVVGKTNSGSWTPVFTVDMAGGLWAGEYGSNQIWHAGNLNKEELAVVSLSDKTIYVNPSTGNDTTGDGTSQKPYKTINRALKDVPEVMTHNYTIQLASGTYNELVVVTKGGALAHAAGAGFATLTIRGDPSNPSAYKISGDNARPFGMIVSTPFVFKLEGVQVENSTTAGLYALSTYLKFHNVNFNNNLTGMLVQFGCMLDFNDAGTINITGKGPSFGHGINMEFGGHMRNIIGAATINISEVKVGYAGFMRHGINASFVNATWNITNSQKVSGSYGFVAWGSGDIHGLVANITNFEYGIEAGNMFNLDVDSAAFDNVTYAYSVSGRGYMDVDETTFTNVTHKFKIDIDGWIDARDLPGVESHLHGYVGKSTIGDGSTAVAHWIDTLEPYTTNGAKLFKVSNAGEEKFYIAHDGKVSVASLMYDGQDVSLGDPDSGGSGYRVLRVPN